MKRFFACFILLESFYAFAQPAFQPANLPQKAQNFLLANFPTADINAAEKGFFNYQVFLSNGVKVTFLWTGGWTFLEGAPGSIPSTVLPAAAALVIEDSYPGANILRIKNEGDKYNVFLDNSRQILVSAIGQLLGEGFAQNPQ